MRLKQILAEHFEMQRGTCVRVVVPKDPENPERFIEQLAQLGPDAVFQAREAMKATDPAYRPILIGILQWLAREKSDKAALAYLRELAQSGEFEAVEALGRCSTSDQDLKRLEAVLATGDETKYAAIRALGSTRRPDAVAILSPYLDHDEDAVRANTANSLGKIGTEGAKKLLIARFEKEESRYANSYWAVLGSLIQLKHEPAMAVFENELGRVLVGEEKNVHNMISMAHIVDRMSDKTKREEICLSMLHSKYVDNLAKSHVVAAMGRINGLSLDAAAALVRVLGDENFACDTRYFAAQALNAGTEHHVEPGITADKDNLARLFSEWRSWLVEQRSERSRP